MEEKRIVAHQIYAPKGANCVINLRFTDNSQDQIIFKPSEMLHFNAACTMLQSRNVFYIPSRQAFMCYENSHESTFDLNF